MKQKGITFLIPIGFAILLFLVLLSLPLGRDSVPQIQFVDQNREFSLSLYYDEYTDKQYLFLPSFLSVSDLTLSCPWYIQSSITTASNGRIDISEASLDTDFSLTVKALGQKEQHYTLQILQCSARKTIAITAQGGLMEYITADKSHKGNVSVAVLDETGKPEFTGTSTISGRGNGTWEREKKPFNLDFSQQISFGPFQDIQQLCLFAEYADESKLRNAIALQAGALQEIPFTSPYCYADLYVNGQYYGLYGLATKDTYLQDSSVSAVFEIPSWENTVHFQTDMHKPIKVHYGSQSEMELRLQEMENAITCGDWEALCKIIDVESFSKKYVLDEFLCNLDMSYASQYFYLDESGVVHCMLPWDYEWSLYSRTTHFEWLPEWQFAGEFFSECWWQDLLGFPEFQAAVCEELAQNYTEDFLDALDQYTANCIVEMEASRSCDLIRWPVFTHDYTFASGFTDLSQFRTLFREYYPRRISFLQNYWENPESFVKVTLTRAAYDTPGVPPFSYHYYFPKGTVLSQYETEILRTTPRHYGWKFLGWYSESGVPLKALGPLTEDLTLIGEYDFQMPEDYIDDPILEAEPDLIPEELQSEATAPPQEAADPPVCETENPADTQIPTEIPEPVLEQVENTADDLPSQDTAPAESADTASDAPISTFSAVFSMLFFLCFFFIILCEWKRNHPRKEVHPSESNNKFIP